MKNWSMEIDVRNGIIHARLEEDGKIPLEITVHKEQAQWFVALKNLIDGNA